MSKLDESDADTFFLAGDEGTYEGGPASSSVRPQRVEAEDDRPATPTAEQLERRERLRRVVTTVVGTLAAASLLVFSFRLGRVTSDPDGTSGEATTASVAVPAIVEPRAPELQPEVRTDAVVTPPEVPPEVRVDPVITPKAPAAAVVAMRNPVVPASPTEAHAPAVAHPKHSVVPARVPAVERDTSALVVREPTQQRRDPPTVSFPD